MWISTIPLPLLSFFWVFFISLMLILPMANTRNCAANNNAENNGDNNINDANRCHPLRLLLRKCWLCKHKCSRQCSRPVHMQHAQPQAPPLPSRDRLGDFQCTKPPTFSHAVELMDADDWLKSMEKKLQAVQYNNREKVQLACHTPFRERGNEASIRVPRMFKSHV
jgi:hypothetical protein